MEFKDDNQGNLPEEIEAVVTEFNGEGVELEEKPTNSVCASDYSEGPCGEVVGRNQTETAEMLLSRFQSSRFPILRLKSIGDRLEECSFCDRSIFIPLMRQHHKSAHSIYHCLRCNFVGCSGAQYRAHLSLHEYWNPTFCCLVGCGKLFANRTTVLYHSVNRHLNHSWSQKRIQELKFRTLTEINFEHRFNRLRHNTRRPKWWCLYEGSEDSERENYLCEQLRATHLASIDNNQESPVKGLSPDPSHALEDLKMKHVNKIRKRYGCVFCDKTFKRKSSQLVHTITHCRMKKGKYVQINASVQSPKRSKLRSKVPINYTATCLRRKDEGLAENLLKGHTKRSENFNGNKDHRDVSSYKTGSLEPLLESKHKFLKRCSVRLVNIGNKVSKECLICGYPVLHSKLAAHVITHLEGISTCPLCSYKGRRSLAEHLNMHFRIKACRCDSCPQSFVYRSELIAHVRKNHSDVPLPFRCQFCTLGFISNRELARHVRTNHTGKAKESA